MMAIILGGVMIINDMLPEQLPVLVMMFVIIFLIIGFMEMESRLLFIFNKGGLKWNISLTAR